MPACVQKARRLPARKPLSQAIRPFVSSGGWWLLLLASPWAQAAGIPTLDTIKVTGNNHALIGAADSATEGTVTAEQLANRPLLRPAEALESVPGLVVTQHSGDGKANQYFLRGFNLDHGSDFATYLDGLPVNVVSHGHGQGYMDLNGLIPELVGGIRYRKGVYAVEDGDFGSTGSARIDYVRRLSSPFISLTGGPHDYRRVLLAGSQEWQGQQWLAAVEGASNDGPWVQPERLRKANGLLRVSNGNASNGYSLTLLAYQSRWVATEHVPEDAILNGEIDRFGSLLPDDGGITHRYSLTGQWAHSDEQGSWHAGLWLSDYGLALYSSPSGYINGAQGDQHEQLDERRSSGGRLERRQPLTLGVFNEWALGTQWRYDRASRLGLYDTVARQPTDTVREDALSETAVAAYAELRAQWIPQLRTTFGLRHDYLAANVKSLAGTFNAANGGHAQDRLNSPKFTAVWTLAKTAELYLNAGQGFHSNDARGATTRVNPRDGSAVDPVALLVPARGSEVGMRLSPLPGWQTSLSLWRLRLGSELVFVGDDGVTEPRGASRRQGLEWSHYYQPLPGLIIDGDLAWSRARFVEEANGGKHVPNAIPLTASVALTQQQQAFSHGLRLRYLGSYDLEETGTERSRAFWTANWQSSWQASRAWQVSLDVLNVLNRRANDIEYWGAACTAAQGPGCNGGNGVDGRLVHPLEPRTVRLGVRWQLQ